MWFVQLCGVSDLVFAVSADADSGCAVQQWIKNWFCNGLLMQCDADVDADGGDWCCKVR